MATFDDLVWKPHPMKGKMSTLFFDNGYGVSVVCTPYSYGGSEGLFELAVLFDGSLCYDTPVTSDVLGYLTPKQVTEHMQQVETLPHRKALPRRKKK